MKCKNTDPFLRQGNLKVGHNVTSGGLPTHSSRKRPGMAQSSKTEWEGHPRGFCELDAPPASKYFGDPQKNWMLNLRVRDLNKMAAQLQAAGIAIKSDPQSYPNGRFAYLHDPEGNPIELWQPKVPDAKGQVGMQFRTVSETR
jgi:predicted enzyme related to lactoylglutathione lyase